MFRSKLWILTCAAILTFGCTSLPEPTPVVSPEEAPNPAAARGRMAPGEEDGIPTKPARILGGSSHRYQAAGPFPIDLKAVPAGVYDPFNKLDMGKRGGRARSLVSEEEMARQRAESMRLAPDASVQQYPLSYYKALSAGTSFDSLDYTDCCGGGGNVPPDPELAVGPNHIIAVVNVAFEIYDKSGNLLAGPTTFSSFFNGTPGCSNTGVFDPNAAYDEREDRFVIGIDGNGDDYCIAATTGSDPTGSWNRFAFATDINGNFFDFPHIGVGNEAIYMGSNQFSGNSFAEARVFAIEKAPLYSGGTPAVVTHSTGDDGTPQPANLRGWNQGTWPTSGPHYIMTEVFDGVTHTVWSWSDPFGADNFGQVGDVTLPGSGGMPIDWPQLGSSRDLQGNDFRGQATEYRNGDLWISTTMACNPGGGTVNCARWARIDPTVPSLVDGGVFGTNGEHRTFPSVAANHCDDMAMGYTKGSSGTYPAVFVAGRESGDPAGQLQTEIQLKAGEITYTSFESGSGAFRWGDYTKMTIDPDGLTFWYLGEYSKDTGTTNGRWGNYVGSFSFANCTVVTPTCGDGVAEGNEVCDGADLRGETCGSQGCTGGTLLCNSTCDDFDKSLCNGCPTCDDDGICEVGEDCNSCANDCISGSTSGASCGNGICEAGNGEDCVSCAADCRGVQNGKPSNRYCCGDGGGQNPILCSDGDGSVCNSGGFSCADVPAVGGSYCCGDFICEGVEDSSNCALDCGAPAFCGDGTCDPGEDECSCSADCGTPPGSEAGFCTDGIDNDCGGGTDCNDADCSGDPACQSSCGDGVCDSSSENCVSCPQDCNGVQNGKPSNRFCCGDGGGTNPVGCGDSRCTNGSFQCI